MDTEVALDPLEDALDNGLPEIFNTDDPESNRFLVSTTTISFSTSGELFSWNHAKPIGVDGTQALSRIFQSIDR